MKEGKWLKTFLGELGLQRYCRGEMQMYCDNQSIIRLAENTAYHQKIRHTQLEYLYA